MDFTDQNIKERGNLMELNLVLKYKNEIYQQIEFK